MAEAVKPQGFRNTGLDLGLIVGLFLACVFIAGPWGDFPLNDDFSFAAAARRLALDHIWRPTGWTGMPLITHAGWGALFCTIASDCSAQTLRWATIAAAIGTLVATYFLGRELGLSRPQRLALTALIAANPLFFALSFTFMTDVTFMGLTAVTLLFMVRALRRDSAMDIILGAAFAVASVLCRQVALFLPLAFCVAALWRRPLSLRAVAIAASPLIITVVTLLLFNQWMQRQGVTPVLYSAQTDELLDVLRSPKKLIGHVVVNSVKIFLYLGLFCLPVLSFRSEESTKAPFATRRLALACAVGFAVAAGVYCAWRGPMPVGINIITSAGIGPRSLSPYLAGIPDNRGHGVLSAGWLAWWSVTVASIVGGSLLLHRLLLTTATACGCGSDRLDRTQRSLEVFFVVSAVAYAGPIVVAGFYDRYLLPLLLLAPFIGVCSAPPRWSNLKAGVLICGLALVSIVWTHDYMAWNRARWIAIDRIRAAGVPATRISGGFELSGKNCFDPKPECRMGDFIQSIKLAKLDGEQYVISLAPLSDYTSVGGVEYSSWFPAGRHEILTLKRTR